jgi:hypothetical protein
MRFLLNALFTAIFVVALSNTVVLPKPAVVEPSPSPAVTPETTMKDIVVLNGLATHYNAKLNNAWYTREEGGPARNQDEGPYHFYGAAGPELRLYHNFRFGMKPYPVLVTSILTERSVLVWVVDYCECEGRRIKGDERLIDLAPEVWDALGVPKSRGVMKITLAILDKMEDPR